MTQEFLRFTPFSSCIDGAFWHVLSKNKLMVYKLEEGPFPLYGHYQHVNNIGSNNKFMIELGSFDKFNSSHPNIFPLEGKILLFNTIENFRNEDKDKFLLKFGKEIILPAIKDGSFIHHPDKLCQFVVLNYSDLKKFKFFYWFAFPAPVFPVNPIMKDSVMFLDDLCETDEINVIFKNLEHTKRMFFSLFLKDGKAHVEDLCHFNINDKECLLGFSDPSINPSYPGWPLRIILFAICCTQIPADEKRSIRLFSYRHGIDESHKLGKSSSILTVELTGINLETTDIRFVGWEKSSNALQPKSIDVSSTMDPMKLTENAVDLNLKLMKWRLVPDLDLDAINDTKCLLLGAGTLGCNVARQLLAWNVKHITLVDNGKVSPSNPVRQNLFTYDQTLAGGLNKALAAAQSLKAIYPGVMAEHVNITIPMPGHPISVSEEDSVRRDCETLSKLVETHDVIFLLLDTREARWLPSVLAYIHGKLVIDAALGFDTYLVMRHGVAPEPGVSPSHNQLGGGDIKPVNRIAGDELGCYFCTDVVGPSNSVKDRSLDQQCTVSRPGVSMIAAALAVELMVTLLQHKDKSKAHADGKTDNFDFISCLGSTPHQIRGYMSCFSSINPFHRASSHCTACSQKVLDAYKEEGLDFLMKVFNNHNYLETITGLTEMKNSIDFDCVTALSDDEDY